MKELRLNISKENLGSYLSIRLIFRKRLIVKELEAISLAGSIFCYLGYRKLILLSNRPELEASFKMVQAEGATTQVHNIQKRE